MIDKRFELLKEPREEHREKYDVTYCKYCGRVKRGDRRGYFNPIKLIAEKYVNRVSKRLPPGYSVKNYKVFKAGREKDGYKLYEIVISVTGPKSRRILRHFRYRDNLGVCPRCSRKLSGYYEALVQIRGPKDKVERAFEEVRHKVEVLDSFVRYERVKEGINVYFLDHPPARRLAKEIVNRRGAKHIVTRSLLKIEDGKRKGIETHSVRIPEFDKYDLVDISGRRYVFLGVNKGRFEVLRVPDMKRMAFPSKHEVRLIAKPEEGFVMDSDEYVASVFVNEDLVYAKVPELLRPGEEVKVYRMGDEVLALPKKKLEEEAK